MTVVWCLHTLCFRRIFRYSHIVWAVQYAFIRVILLILLLTHLTVVVYRFPHNCLPFVLNLRHIDRKFAANTNTSDCVESSTVSSASSPMLTWTLGELDQRRTLKPLPVCEFTNMIGEICNSQLAPVRRKWLAADLTGAQNVRNDDVWQSDVLMTHMSNMSEFAHGRIASGALWVEIASV
jgi:hypothetical protein